MSMFFVSAFLWVNFKIFSMYICGSPTAAAHGCKPLTSAGNMALASLTTAAKARCKILDDFWMFIRHSLWVLTHTLNQTEGDRKSITITFSLAALDLLFTSKPMETDAPVIKGAMGNDLSLQKSIQK